MKDSIFRLLLNQIIMNLDISLFAIVVICIDYHKRLIKNGFGGEYSLTGSPRFCTVCRFFKSFRKVIQRLECIGNFCDFLNSLSDHTAEFFLQILADNKYNLVKSSLQCIMDRIIHNDLSIRSYWCKLFDSFSKTAANSGCHDYKCGFFHLRFLPLFFFI